MALISVLISDIQIDKLIKAGDLTEIKP